MKNLNLRGVRQILRIESAHVSITESQVLEGTFTYDSTMVEGSAFQIGTAVADEINVTVTDPNKQIEAYIDETYSIYIAPYVENRSQASWTLIGTYVIAELDTSYLGRAKVKFQDKMVTMDVPYDFQSGTLYANLQNLGLTLSLTQQEITFLSGLSVLNRQTMTKRDFIRGCALLMWENAYLKPNGALSFRSLTTTSQSFTPADRFSSQLNDEVTIGPVTVVDDSGAVIFTRGSANGQKIEITSSSSPMISLIGSIEGLATYYSSATIPGRGIADFTYTPLTMTVLSTWGLEPGDVVTYVDKDNTSHTTVITSVAHVVNGASACTSAGEAKVRQSQQIPSQTDETRVIVQQLEKGVDYAQTTASEAMPKYGTCSTGASTVAKTVTGITNFSLQTGARVSLLMTNTNTANNPTLNINGTGAKPIVTSDGVRLTTTNNTNKAWLANSLVTFVYDGTNWRIDDNLSLTRINNILTENIVGTNGWINLKNGTFNYGSGKLVWNGSTLSVQGTVNSTNGNIGGWDVGQYLLSNSTTISGTEYLAFMQSTDGTNRVNSFGVRATPSGGSATYPFRVTYDGKLYASDANITGTINATGGTISGNMNVTGTLTGGTISGATITGEEISIYGNGSVTNGSTTYNKYSIRIQTHQFYDTSNRGYRGIYIGGDILNSSNDAVSNSSITINPLGGVDIRGQTGVALQIGIDPMLQVGSSRTDIYNNLYVYGTIIENSHRISQRITGMAANGDATSVSSGTTSRNLLTDAITLSANHRYYISYMVQWSANSSGRRWSSISIGSTDVGIIASDHQTAMASGVTICRGSYWIQSSASDRSLQITGWQNSGSELTATVRYQLIDFGE